MARPILVDTDVLIDYLRDFPLAVDFLENPSETLLISVISVAELFAGVREGQEREKLNKFLSTFEIVMLNRSIAEQGGLFRRDFGKSHGTGLADALIAASAEFHGARLATLNDRHFPMLSDVWVPYRKK